MDEAIPAVVELAVDKICGYVEVEGFPLTRGHVRKTLRRFISGWHVTISASLFLAGCVLMTNVALLVWGTYRKLHEGKDGVLQIFQGDCSQMHTIFTWSHVGINILSTLLLAASNSACQILSAPTRKEVDYAHAHGIWLDVGVPSVRNLRHVALKRVVIYLLLALSSIPLHLVYNSIIFPTTSASVNQVALVEPRFIRGPAWNLYYSALPRTMKHTLRGGVGKRTVTDLQNKAKDGALKRLSNSECVQQLSAEYVSSYSNFLVVTEDSSQVASIGGAVQLANKLPARANDLGALDWFCLSTARYKCNGSRVVSDPSSWEMFVTGPNRLAAPNNGTLKIDHCLADEIEPHCTISMSQPLLAAVIVCNFLKMICFAMVVKWSGQKSLVTVGDAIDSFLRRPDPTTRHMGPLSAFEVRQGVWGRLYGPRGFYYARTWAGKRYRWFAAAGWKRWLITLLCCLCVYLPTTILPSLAKGAAHGFGNINNMGNLNPNAVLTESRHWNLTKNVLFVNLPQLVISFCYLFFNVIITSSLAASEYSDFGKHRKSLRVTSSTKLQRSTYWLQVPYRYALPMIFVWTVFHWLVSQSIFLARLRIYTHFGMEPERHSKTINGIGFSPIPVLMSVMLGGSMIVALVLFGWRRYPGNVPVVSTCTAAISAACHAPTSPDEGDKMAQKPLMYGVLRDQWCDHPLYGEVQMVGFSSYEVDPLMKGQIYK